MTTNYEKIKNMNIDEMAEFFDDWGFIGAISQSVDGIKQWLEEECEDE
jgi:hypothetical protein